MDVIQMQHNQLTKRNANKPVHSILNFIMNRLKTKDTMKEIAEAIASIELEQVINEMCYEIDK